MKLNSILKLSSLGLVSLGLISTVALTATSCSDVVDEITLTGDFATSGRGFGESSVKINKLIALTANDKSTTVVKDAGSAEKFSNESTGAAVSVFGAAGVDGAVIFSVTTLNAELKTYSLNGYYTEGDVSQPGTVKAHAITVKITINKVGEPEELEEPEEPVVLVDEITLTATVGDINETTESVIVESDVEIPSMIALYANTAATTTVTDAASFLAFRGEGTTAVVSVAGAAAAGIYTYTVTTNAATAQTYSLQGYYSYGNIASPKYHAITVNVTVTAATSVES
jgi:hypothetical protein